MSNPYTKKPAPGAAPDTSWRGRAVQAGMDLLDELRRRRVADELYTAWLELLDAATAWESQVAQALRAAGLPARRDFDALDKRLTGMGLKARKLNQRLARLATELDARR